MYDKLPPVPQRRTTVQLDEQELQAATQLLKALLGSVGNHPAGGETLALGSAELAERARKIHASRRRRFKIFGKSMFGEPAWDMLIILYMNEAMGPRLPISRLGDMADTPPTTALRWIEYLEQQGLVRREPHPTDRRSVFVELTEKGRSAMEHYLAESIY